jgi:hypothetical protein
MIKMSSITKGKRAIGKNHWRKDHYDRREQQEWHEPTWLLLHRLRRK